MVWCASNASNEVAKMDRTTADDLNQISGSKQNPTTSRCEQSRPDVQGFAGARRAVCEHGIVRKINLKWLPDENVTRL
jgi:hypothetical protein